MDERSAGSAAETGYLPTQGRLAVSYVPTQKPNSPQYSAAEGLKNGTLFPGLNLPYRNYIPSRSIPETPLGEIMIMSFAVAELGLYLDTHPEDKEALQLHNNYVRLLRDAMAAYEKEIGPITQETVMEGKYSWIKDPWPWDER